ncbi:FAD-binding protein [Adlercreutzia sp. R25]|uniref:FAD-binding protein n=1 Tax=Adlercreutzia shanghongiae TaxID=3111773 RepID=A0ABU6J1P1_9ACTN|nr:MULTISPECIES: FAD-binding protein [unclassified Adlercreutzia]MEC4273780.1 FAD-binding protein [Adlercreutzia sp. R25]MEC4295858.1 FAD-binding protein [Adlercreutzia sp. R22]
MAGTTAAVTVAAEGNGATCLLLEKGDNEYGGGNSQYSAGMISATNDYENALTYFKALRGENDTVSDEICEAHITALTEHADWLRSLGAGDDLVVSWETEDNDGYVPEYPELCPTQYFGRIRFNGEETGGFTHVQQFMVSKVKENSDTVTHLLGARALHLFQDSDTNEILGLTYEVDGKTVNAKANHGVIMCCGGFENNSEMLQNYHKSYGAHPLAGLCNEGDGITMCAEVKAHMWHMNGIAGFNNNFSTLDGSGFASNDGGAAIVHDLGIIVGTHGRRYYMEVGGYNNKKLTDDDLRVHVGHRHGDQNLGGMWMHQQLPPLSWYVFDQAAMDQGATKKLGDIDPVAEAWGYKDETIEGLASQMDVPAEELSKTIAHWNSLCEAGEDLAFYRPSDTLFPILQPPFYAMKMIPNFLNTNGGPERSAKGEILDLDRNPIPHLYGAGEFGSIWSDMYNGGGNLTECLAWGRISVRNCLGIA